MQCKQLNVNQLYTKKGIFKNIYNIMDIAIFFPFILSNTYYAVKKKHLGFSLDFIPLYGDRDENGNVLCRLNPEFLTFSPFLTFMGKIGSTAG